MFKVGDKVRVLDKSHRAPNYHVGYEFIIDSISYYPDDNIAFPGSDRSGMYFSDLELVNDINNKIMNILEKFKLLGLGEPEKTFRKLGIQDEKGQLTSDGKALYEAWKFEQDKAAFKTIVCEPLLAEQEAEKAK